MTDQATTTAEDAPNAEVTDALPPVPSEDGCDDGYDWMERLPEPTWRVQAGNAERRMLGDWPYVVVAFHDDPWNNRYGLAVFDDHAVKVTGYTSAGARDRAADEYAEN
jgi:hypothetical protein